MTNPTSNFGWQMPTSTDLVTDLPADFAVFGQAVDTSMADLKGGTTGQILSKATSTDMDFTWITNDVGDITAVTAGTGISGGGTSGAVTITNDMATTITAAGDIVIGTGSGTYDNLPIGTTAQVLTADTTVSPYKVKWATPSSGGMTLLSTTTLSGATTTISSISQSYKNLVIQIYGVSNATANGIFRTSINSAFPVNSFAYRSQYSTITTFATVTDYLQISANVDLLRTNTDNAFTITISDYTNTSAATKTFTCNTGFLNTSSQLTQAFTMGQIVLSAGISSFTFSNVGGNLSTGTVLIYGVS